MTAASRRVPLVEGSGARWTSWACAGRSSSPTSTPLAGDAGRRPRVRGAAVERPWLHRRHAWAVRTRGGQSARADHRRRTVAVRRVAPPASHARGTRVVVSDRTTTDTCNDKLAACRHLRANGVAAAATLPARDGAVAASASALRQAARRAGERRCLRGASTAAHYDFFLAVRAGARSSRSTSPATEFTIDLLCDFEGRPLSVVPRERVGHPGRGDRPRAHQRRSRRSSSSACQCAGRLKFAGPVQHPVPPREGPARGLRDQPAVLGRHPAHDRRRRRLSANAGRVGPRSTRRTGDRSLRAGPLDDQLRIVVLRRAARAWRSCSSRPARRDDRAA